MNIDARSNRARIDCVAADDSGWFSVYINDTPVASVPIPNDVKTFDAVGFAGTAQVEGLVFSIDDVVAVAERPPPPRSRLPSRATRRRLRMS